MVRIVIPSAYRHNCIKTLEFVPWATVVVPHDQADLYRESNPKANVVSLPKDHPPGIGSSRDWIIQKSGFGDHIQIDDDCAGCVILNRPAGNPKKLTGEEFQNLVVVLRDVAEDMGKFMFGLADSPNAMRFSPDKPFRLTGNMRGCGMGFRTGSKLEIPPELKYTGEDAWLSLLNAHLYRSFYIDQRFCLLAEANSNPGGCSAHRSGTREKDACDHMVKCFGEAAEVRTGLTRGFSVFPKIPF